MSALIAVVAGTVLALAAYAAVDLWARRRLAVRRRVMVTTIPGAAFHGILWARRGPWLILRDVTVHADGEAVPADGEVIIDRRIVLFVQAVD